MKGPVYTSDWCEVVGQYLWLDEIAMNTPKAGVLMSMECAYGEIVISLQVEGADHYPTLITEDGGVVKWRKLRDKVLNILAPHIEQERTK